MHGDGHEMDDDAGDGPGGEAAGIAIPKAIPAEPGFIARFSHRFNPMLNDNNPKFNEFESQLCLLQL